MNTQRIAILLTVTNLLILITVLLLYTKGLRHEVVPVLRGHALELVDEHGKVRAEIKILPAEPAINMPDGTVDYPGSVLFRLFDSEGGPNVKISATEDGAGIVIGGESGYVQILSRSSDPIVKLSNRNGEEQIIKINQP